MRLAHMRRHRGAGPTAGVGSPGVTGGYRNKPGPPGVDSGMPWLSWRRYFENRRARPLPDLSRAARGIPPEWLPALRRSLAIFQLGESKGGRLAEQIDHVRLDGVDDDYRAAVKLFVAEEQRHGEVLAAAVEALGGQLLADNWTETLFVGLRRRVGVRGKLLVLLAAEVVGLAFYRTVAGRLPAGPLRRALAEIDDDEVAHLAFHRDFFATQLDSPAARAAGAALWWLVAVGAGVAVAVDHRRTFRALETPPREIVERFFLLIAMATPVHARAIEPNRAPTRVMRA